jgi:hypothetical protein
MKKFFLFMPVLSLALVLSCGGSSTSNPSTQEEAYVVGSQFVDAFIGELPAGSASVDVDSPTYNSEVPYNWTAQSCYTSGTFEFRGTNYYNSVPLGSWKYSYRVILTNCQGPDLMCNTGTFFTLNGEPTITYEYNIDTHKYTVAFDGSYSYSGPISGSCAMNMTLTFDEVPETGAISLSGASGTMCGYPVGTIQEMEQSGVDYCDVLDEAIGN